MLSAKVFATRTSSSPFKTTRHFKSLGALWRSKATQAALQEENDALRYSAKIQDHGEVRPFEDIPGPEKSVKNMINFYRRSEGFTKGHKHTQLLFEEYGPIVKHTFMGETAVHIIDPDNVEKVFRAEGEYPRRPALDFWMEYRKRGNNFPGIAVVQGKEWQRARKCIAPKMMRLKTVEENIDNFSAVTEEAIARFTKLKEACGPNHHIPNLHNELKKFSMESVGTVAFNTRLGLYQDSPPEKAMKFIEAVDSFIVQSQKISMSTVSMFLRRYIDTPALKKFFKACDEIVEIGEYFIKNKMEEVKEMTEEGIEPSDEVVPLLTYLLTKEKLSLQEASGLAIDVIAAGVDTTATTLLWMLYHLARHPEVQDKLYQESLEVVGKDGNITAVNIGKMSYLKACLKESMRLSNVLTTNGRILEQDVVLSGYRVPAKTWIFMEHYCTARSEKYFEDPLEFKPERWLRENRGEYHAFSILPFGYGVRMCVGRRVAELEMYLFLCKLLQRFRVEYIGEELDAVLKVFLFYPEKPVKIKLMDRI
ncbi:cytochrome P450 27C1-like [Montipora foliosa]|uniref:cytochrome P450 27C1-like n=1 Tax=Montipora foliosa TaxID=591990 RepID=UPI0035F1F810